MLETNFGAENAEFLTDKPGNSGRESKGNTGDVEISGTNEFNVDLIRIELKRKQS